MLHRGEVSGSGARGLAVHDCHAGTRRFGERPYLPMQALRQVREPAQFTINSPTAKAPDHCVEKHLKNVVNKYGQCGRREGWSKTRGSVVNERFEQLPGDNEGQRTARQRR